jgi:hypothetical protein
MAGFDPEIPAWIRDRHETHDTAVALLPAPWEGGKRHSLAGDLVDVAAYVLEATDARRQNRVVAGFPLGEILDYFAAGLALVFFVDPRQEPVRCAGTMRPDGVPKG